MTDLLAQARIQLESGDIDGCFATITRALGSPTGPKALALGLLGEAFLAAAMPAEAGEAFATAAEAAGDQAFAYLKPAAMAKDRAGDLDNALSLAIRANRLDPADADMIYLIARELDRRGETELLAHYKNRLTASDTLDHLYLARKLIGADSRNPFTLSLYRKLARLEPDDTVTRLRLMAIAREVCDYDTIDAEDRYLEERLAAGDETVLAGETPYSHLLHIEDERLNRLAVNNRDIAAPPPAGASQARRNRPHQFADKIRVGYLSGDFSGIHATMRLLRRVLELHDRDRFDVTLYCYTPDALLAQDDGGRALWGSIVRIADLDDEAAAARIRADGIDILVDLKGHTGGSRCQILNFGAAPLQLAWLGFPGSTVNVDLDYVIGDRIVLPDSARPRYHEHFLRLPVCYQPNDPVHRPMPAALARTDLGLPPDRFVFASFNAQRKITPKTLALWCSILKRAPSSLLWVMIEGETARANFSARIERHGIAADRVLFAGLADYPTHIARLQAADLGLDTFPYNGHTTTSDMLWAGLPVVTRRGRNFASRVSESLLTAVGLQDFVAADDEAFVDLALRLVENPEKLILARRKLMNDKLNLPLFDAAAFCRALEQAYGKIYARAAKSESPVDLDV